jgi:hypothetical protein
MWTETKGKDRFMSHQHKETAARNVKWNLYFKTKVSPLEIRRLKRKQRSMLSIKHDDVLRSEVRRRKLQEHFAKIRERYKQQREVSK